LIKIQYLLIFIIITSLILPIQFQTLIFVNGQIQKESNLIIYDKDKLEHNNILSHPDDSMLIKVDVKIEGTLLNDTMNGGEGNDVIDGGKGDDMITGGIGSDTFICDENDILVDFNSNEEDNIIGSCSTEYLAENKEEKEVNELKETQIEKIHGDNNIFPVELATSKFEKMSKPIHSSLKSPQQSESLNDFNTPSQISKNFQKIDPSSTKSSNQFDIQIPLPHANVQSSSNR